MGQAGRRSCFSLRQGSPTKIVYRQRVFVARRIYTHLGFRVNPFFEKSYEVTVDLAEIGGIIGGTLNTIKEG